MGVFTCPKCAGSGMWFSNDLIQANQERMAAAAASDVGRPLFKIELPDGSFAYKVRGQIRDTDKLVFDGPSAHQQDGLPEPGPHLQDSPQSLDWGDEKEGT